MRSTTPEELLEAREGVLKGHLELRMTRLQPSKYEMTLNLAHSEHTPKTIASIEARKSLVGYFVETTLFGKRLMFPHFSFGKNGADNYADVRANAFCQIFADRNHLPLYNSSVLRII